MTKYLCAVAALAVSATTLSTAASAATINAEGFKTKVVSTHGLNLATLEGQQRLTKRVEYAARTVCTTGDRSLAMQVKEQTCYNDVLKSAKVQVAALIEKAVRARG